MPYAMNDMLAFNRRFVENKDYKQYLTGKLPDKKLAVLSCMDTRLTRLLPAALDFKNGDIKLIQNAGALVSHPFGSVMRSLLICVYEMGVEEIAVIGHLDCGMRGFEYEKLKRNMQLRGISNERIEMVESLGFDLDAWFKGFTDPRSSVIKTAASVRNHPFMPQDVRVGAFLIDPATGAVEQVTE